jgi:TniQ protein
MSEFRVINMPSARSMRPTLPYLFGATPIGVATGQVEALSSFVSRLGERRSMRASNVVSTALKFAAQKRSDISGKRHSYQLNGRAKGAFQTVTALNLATETTGLETLTLLPWQELIEPAMHGVLRPHIAYCRDCVRSDRQRYETPYIRLLWFISEVSSCPVHEVRLYDACVTCGERLPAIPWLNNPFFCMTCRKDVSEQKSARFQGRPTFLSQWISKELSKLLALTNGGGYTLSPGRLAESFRHIVDSHFDGSTGEFSHYFKLDTVHGRKYCKGACRPTFPALLRMLYQLQISPVDLLISQNNALELTQRVKLTRTSSPIARRRQLTERAKARIKKDLEKLLAADGEIIGPTAFADTYDGVDPV